MTVSSRRALARAYKDRKRQMGVFAVRCTADGQVWVGVSRNLDTERNPIWFTLKLGSHRCRPMQAAWDIHGAESFTYEVLEHLDEAQHAFPDTGLKELCAAWMERLRAAPAGFS